MICTSAVRFPSIKIKSIKLSICLNISLPFCTKTMYIRGYRLCQ